MRKRDLQHQKLEEVQSHHGGGGEGGQLGEKWGVGSNFWRNDWFVIGKGFWESE